MLFSPFYDSMTVGHTKRGEIKMSPGTIMGVVSSYVARNFSDLSRCVQCWGEGKKSHDM